MTLMMEQFTAIANLDQMVASDRRNQPEEVASMVAFLLSDEVSYINGQLYGINSRWDC